MTISSLSNIIARRATLSIMGARRPLTAQAQASVQDLESALQNLRWSDCKDSVKEIRQLMNECKTNHAIRVPDAALENQVSSKLGAIRAELNGRADHNAIDAEILGLKRMVKSELYTV
eukprot:CAMPEP_0176179392 /NCGR_PEP_ID=MMETSP0120_2-20121206/91915_1 /TAXON_ID=160619 /ORGANISM="Kryptoperidinium foliaceum, Strain CCMP 1326" /LENGTH=117 /DNA_ID=CAMNT_0017517563 /DNA_START=275 /DNA_END=628 /DNA_ORIENTATION=-